MPLQSLLNFLDPNHPKFRLALVGQGPFIHTLTSFLSKPEFLSASPWILVAGWAPFPQNGTRNGRSETAGCSGCLEGVPKFDDLPSLLKSCPDISMVLDLSPQSENIPLLRELVPQDVSIASVKNLEVLAGVVENICGYGDSKPGDWEHENTFAMILDQIDSDIIILDKDGRIMDMNKHARKEFDFKCGEYFGTACAELGLCLPCTEGDPDCAIFQTLKTSKQTARMATEVTKEGLMRSFNVVFFPLKNPLGEVSQIITVRRDTTEQSRLEKRLLETEKMAAIGELSTFIAHEIRNPLFAIGGFSKSLLRNESLDVKARQKAQIILEESARLDEILKNIINFARPVEQKLGLIDVVDQIHKTVSLMSIGSAECGIKVVVDIEKDLPKAYGNADSFRQALINIIKNAMEAMPDGGTLTVRAQRNIEQVIIEIEDTGVGISPKAQELIFNPFYSTKHGGSGLGLAMTRKLMEDMGCKISLSSQLDHGTKATFTLPVALALDDVAETGGAAHGEDRGVSSAAAGAGPGHAPDEGSNAAANSAARP